MRSAANDGWSRKIEFFFGGVDVAVGGVAGEREGCYYTSAGTLIMCRPVIRVCG